MPGPKPELTEKINRHHKAIMEKLGKPTRLELQRRGLHDATIKLNHMKLKDRDKDKWLTKVRAPYERVFSKRERRVHYQGIKKNQFRAFGRAIAFNLKRLVALGAHETELTLA